MLRLVELTHHCPSHWGSNNARFQQCAHAHSYRVKREFDQLYRHRFLVLHVRACVCVFMCL
jgi:hypothetical protein